MSTRPLCLSCAGVEDPTERMTPEQFDQLRAKVKVLLDGVDVTDDAFGIPRTLADRFIADGARAVTDSGWVQIWTRPQDAPDGVAAVDVDRRRTICERCFKEPASTIQRGAVVMLARADR